MTTNERLQLLALCTVPGMDWSLVAREAQRPGGLERLRTSNIGEATSDARKAARLLADAGPLNTASVSTRLSSWRAKGLRLVTVLDDDYPLNLRTIYNLPPFLFYLGDLRADDAYSVAVVGTREPSSSGLRRARRMADGLARSGVTVLSGLARGVDTVAHEAALDARGRTIAVLGSGLLRIYPPENAGLAERIARSGAVVSRFWPEAPPAHYNFPRRNVVTSGMGQGTVVIEATATSGAKMQARLAMEHGKLVFLIASLVEEHRWAQTYAARGAIVVKDVDDVLKHLRSVDAVRGSTDQRLQLSLKLA